MGSIMCPFRLLHKFVILQGTKTFKMRKLSLRSRSQLPNGLKFMAQIKELDRSHPKKKEHAQRQMFGGGSSISNGCPQQLQPYPLVVNHLPVR